MSDIGDRHHQSPRAGAAETGARAPAGRGAVGGLHHFTVAAATLPPDNAIQREPTRPLHLRTGGFEEKFDRHTLVYDAIAASETGPARLVCPPLLNLQRPVEQSRFWSPDGLSDYSFTIRNLDRQSQILIHAPPSCRSVRMESPLGSFTIDLNPAANSVFAGQRVVFTVSRNNRLVWIKDWARFYRDVHGATAFVIVDNQSSAYSAAELLAALDSVEGIACAAVVEWPFKHGPTGVGQKKYWDSNFSQLGAFEVLRWRFLQQARSVLNCDIDELVLPLNRRSVFDHVEDGAGGVVAFYGDWVFGFEDRTRAATEDDPIRFRDFIHVMKRRPEYRYGIIPHYPMRCRAKWAAVPRSCPVGAQWHVHTVNGWWRARMVTGAFQFRHFREINFNWKYDRLKRQVMDPALHTEDFLLQSTFARVAWDR